MMPPFQLPGFSSSTPLETAAKDLSAGLHTILDHSPTAIFVKRVPDWRYLFVNRTFETAFRLRREDVIGRRDEDFFPPDVVSGVRVLDEKVLATGESHSAEELVPHADGSLHTYISVKFPLRNSKGEIYAIAGMATDISDRKRAEDAVQAILKGTSNGTGEEFLRSLVLELSRALGVRWAFVGRLVRPQCERVRTVALADTGKIINNFEYDLKGTPCANVMGQSFCVIPSGVANRFPEDRLLREMGVEAYLGIPLWNSKGSPLGLIVALHDRPLPLLGSGEDLLKIFASRASAELQRLESESLWKTLVQSAPQVICQVDREERIRFMNHLIPPLTMEQVLGASLYEFIPPNFRESVRRTIQGVLETGRVDSFEVLGPVQSEESRWYDVTVGPVFEEGTVTSLILIASDIHERRRATDLLRQSEARWRTLVESAPQVILQIDREERICFFNRLIPPLTTEQIQGALFYEFVPEGFRETVRRKVRGVFETARVDTFESEGPGPSGVARWYQATLGPVFEEERISSVILVASDITDRKKAEADRLILEEQLVQSQKMDAIGRLAGGVAHDFNNLLTVIQGHLVLLQGSLKPENPLRVHADTALQASQSAAEVTRQLLMFSRKSIQKPVVLDLNAVLKDQHAILRRLIGEHIDLDMRPSTEPCFLRCDVSQIRQVILNLAVNARDAMPAGGRLSFLTRQESREGRAFVELEVADTGAGIAPEVLPRIFEPFFSTKETGRGTGLGLSLVHGVVTQAGGSIQVRSQVGRGTRFLLQFPLAEKPAQEPVPEKAAALAEGKESILVVEDDPSVRSFTGMVLARNGYRIREAGLGAEALQILERMEEPVDLLLTDIVMPGMNGRQLAEAALRLRPELRVLYVTGYTDDEIVHHGVHASQIEVLEKPYSPVALLTRVRQILDRPGAGHPKG
jgi:PAS domain S-box-containing protein